MIETLHSVFDQPDLRLTMIFHFMLGDAAMAAYVFVLRSSITGQHYIGSTTKLQERVSRYSHYSRVSRPGGPWECVYVEVCDSLEQARTRERYLRSMDGLDEKIRILYTVPPRDGNRRTE